MSASRLALYVPVVRKFVLRVLLYHAAVASRLGLNPVDVSSLRLLGEQSLSPGELSEELALTGAATTALIDRLASSGFVTRTRSTEDRRRVSVHANQARLQEVNAIYADQGTHMSKLLSTYSAEEFHTILDFLERTSVILTQEGKAMRERATRLEG